MTHTRCPFGINKAACECLALGRDRSKCPRKLSKGGWEGFGPRGDLSKREGRDEKAALESHP